jgi:hypothetical protein
MRETLLALQPLPTGIGALLLAAWFPCFGDEPSREREPAEARTMEGV